MGSLWVAFWFFILPLCCTRQPCRPFGLRLSFGQAFHDRSSTQKLVISFNTQEQCARSYVTVAKRGQIYKQYCSTEVITIQTPSNSLISQQYSTTVHHCCIQNIQFEQSFSYNGYGWDGKSQIIPYSDDKITTSIMDPNKSQSNNKFIILADWGKIYTKKYISLQASFKKLLSEQPNIRGVIVNGDIGYDLDSNNCQNYQDYLTLSSQIAAYWPIIYVTGNHQYNSQNNHQLYVKSFILHNLETKLVAKINLGSFLLLAYDPYEAIYGGPKNIRSDISPLDQLITNFKSQLQNSKRQNKPVIVSSHYPVSCSSNKSAQCKNDVQFLQPFLDLLFDYKVGFYIGAHYHSYERNYPYLRNKTTVKIDPPYEPQKNGYLVNIVQGVAGNDDKIIEQYKEISDSTAFYTKNVTGFGILTVNKEIINYKHYSTQDTMTLKDEFNVTIYGQMKLSPKLQLLQQ